MNTQRSKTVVLGLGNILHSDDGVGARAVERLQSDERLPHDVSFIEGGTLGLELLNYLWDCSDLMVLDAVDVGQAPGTLIRMSGAELHKLPGNGSVHHLGLTDLLAALRILTKRPPRVSLLGIQPATTDWGMTLSPAVENALGPLTEAALSELCHRRQVELNTEA
jgi:hydrogenase maturation protease